MENKNTTATTANNSKGLEMFEHLNHVSVVRQDLPGDPLLSEKPVKAAFQVSWIS